MKNKTLSTKSSKHKKSTSFRKQRGKIDGTVMFPAPPSNSEMPADYAGLGEHKNVGGPLTL